MNITDLIKKMKSDQIADGTKIVTSTGQYLIYKNGTLSWMTQGGYVSTGLILTDATLSIEYDLLEPKEKQLSFSEAMQYIAEGDKVEMVVDKGEFQREYTISDLGKIDKIITNQEYFADVYQAYFYVVVDQPTFDPPEYPKDEAVINPDAKPKTERDGDYSKKLDKEDAWDILKGYHIKKKSATQLSEEYDVSVRMIYYVLDGTHWKEVKEAFAQYYWSDTK